MFPFFPLILCALGGAAAGFAICVVLDKMITKKRIQEIVKDESLSVPESFKYKIKEAKKNTVKVGIFDKRENELKEIEIQSEKGVSSKLSVNKWELC
ncbi:MAG: hypothetical protein IKH86_02885 [Prevotella sp.]|nr:hypothetical protein [Prevotella sp.]